jgi:hypothetical protein
MTVGFQPLGPGVVHCFLLSPKTGTEPQRWNPVTLELWNLLFGLQSWFNPFLHQNPSNSSIPFWMNL